MFTASFWRPALAMWVWASLIPGMAKAPWRSMTLVLAVSRRSTEELSPAAAILPLPPIAMAETRAE